MALCKNLIKLNQPIVRSYLRPVQSLVPQRRDIYRRNNDVFGNIFHELDNVVREAERAFNKFQRDGIGGTFHNLSPLKAYEYPIIINEDGTRLLRLRFNLDGFKPENIKLTIKDRILTVKASQGEERTGNNSMRCLKDYHYEYELPKDVDIEKISSKQCPDGTLLVEAILPKAEAKDEAVNIPIEKN